MHLRRNRHTPPDLAQKRGRVIAAENPVPRYLRTLLALVTQGRAAFISRADLTRGHHDH
jgi:hypothetical protein